jgi:hypothetical protein
MALVVLTVSKALWVSLPMSVGGAVKSMVLLFDTQCP